LDKISQAYSSDQLAYPILQVDSSIRLASYLIQWFHRTLEIQIEMYAFLI